MARNLKQKFIDFFVAFIIFLFFALPAFPARSFETIKDIKFELQGTKPEPYLFLEGMVEPGDYDKVVEKWKTGKYKGIMIASGGGNAVEGIRIADFIYDNKISLVIPPKQLCASACAIIAFASPTRKMFDNSGVGVHRAHSRHSVTNDKGEEEEIRSENEGSTALNHVIAIKLEKYGTPTQVIVRWLTTSPIISEDNPYGISVFTGFASVKYNLGFTVLRSPPE